MFKHFISIIAVFLLSGCCRFFGICASASVHTSISAPEKLAQQDSPQRVSTAPDFTRAGAIRSNQLGSNQ